ncbi:hypothetical protein ADK90_31895 [Streptomyces sp. XY413]|uniref:hypothetical protein n=1 Tax=Streptomyces sp. XY413 TaxID=1519479 RepID=UPI0006AE94C9|nr:hypothetical protein [Streptomyces sp. XY413]KOV15204.1 hypothetical protein ADK90_31895 [Streptomyces sp. XY413]
MPVDQRWTLWSKWPASRSSTRHITSVVKLSVKTMKCIRPLVLIADIAFTENRFPTGEAVAGLGAVIG